MHFYQPIPPQLSHCNPYDEVTTHSPFNKKVGRDCEICMSSRSINIFCLLEEWFQGDAGSAKSFRPMTNGSISVPESFICGKVDQRLTLLTLLIHGIAREFFFSRFKLFRTEVDQTRSPKEVATRAGRIRPWFLQATWHTGWQVRKWNMSLLTTKHWQGAYPPLSRFSWFFDVGEVSKCATGFLLKEYILYSYGQYIIWNRVSMVLKIYWSWPFPYCP